MRVHRILPGVDFCGTLKYLITVRKKIETVNESICRGVMAYSNACVEVIGIFHFVRNKEKPSIWTGMT
jgi:hypothetical protein